MFFSIVFVKTPVHSATAYPDFMSHFSSPNCFKNHASLGHSSLFNARHFPPLVALYWQAPQLGYSLRASTTLEYGIYKVSSCSIVIVLVSMFSNFSALFSNSPLVITQSTPCPTFLTRGCSSCLGFGRSTWRRIYQLVFSSKSSRRCFWTGGSLRAGISWGRSFFRYLFVINDVSAFGTLQHLSPNIQASISTFNGWREVIFSVDADCSTFRTFTVHSFSPFTTIINTNL